MQWNTAALAALLAVKAGPTVGARALAILHTCMFDAWAAYDPRALGTQLGGTMRASSHAAQNGQSSAVLRPVLSTAPGLFGGPHAP